MRLGTRGSALALAQARAVARGLEGAGAPTIELVPIRTGGDRHPGDGRSRLPGDKSRFVKEIEDALLDGEVDLAVHSAKDVPAQLPEALGIVGVPKRGDARDALLGADALADLRTGAQVGTGSLRRRAQLLAARPDLSVRELRGNVDTRIARLDQGDFDALVLARAGLDRLEEARGAPIPPAEMTPSPGQGCLVLEARSDDPRAAELGEAITDRQSALELTAERALVGALGASCRTPIGAHAETRGETLTISAFVGLPDGRTWIRDLLEGGHDEPALLGESAGSRLVAAGAEELLRDAERMVDEGSASGARAPTRHRG